MKLWISLAFIMVSAISFAKEGGNGGGVHDCGSRGVELYDFYEGRSALLHNIPVWKVDSKLTIKDYLDKAIAHMESDIPEVVEQIKLKLREILAIPYENLVINVSIPLIPDADIAIVDEGCEYRQVANWNERFNKVIFSRSVFERLDNMSKAGLFIHEVIYKLSRDSKVSMQNSDLVRKIVAKIFSNEKLTSEDGANIYSKEAIINHSLPFCNFYIQKAHEILDLHKDTDLLCKNAQNEKALQEAKTISRRLREQAEEIATACSQKCLLPKAVDQCLSLPESLVLKSCD